MSILKYNNGGTWEAINIDHASTADSALYDDDGNIISSTYFPLSGGDDHKLTGDLYLDIGNDSWRNIRIYNNTTPMVTIASSNVGHAYIGTCNSEGSMQTGMLALPAGDLYLFSNGSGNIVFRPKGPGNATNLVYIDQNGLQVGGHPVYSKGRVDVALSASSSAQTVQTFTITPGTWILISHMDSNVSSTTTYNHIIDIAGLNRVTRDSMASGGGCLNGFIFSISANSTCTISTYVSVACTIRNTVWYARIS